MKAELFLKVPHQASKQLRLLLVTAQQASNKEEEMGEKSGSNITAIFIND